MNKMISILAAFFGANILRSCLGLGIVAPGGGSLTLTQRVEARGVLVTELNGILDAPEARTDNLPTGELTGELSEAQQKRHDAITTELRSLDEQIAKGQARVDRDNQQAQLESRARQTDTGHFVPGLQGRSRSENRDVAQFSLGRALRMASEGRGLDGIEAEMAQEGEAEARAAGFSISSGSIMIGSIALTSERRDQTATGTANLGGNLVQTTVGSLLDSLMEKLVFSRLGADVNTGLVGNFAINRIVRGSPPVDKGENGAANEIGMTFEPAALNPRRTPSYVDISKQLFMQSGERNIERRITNHVLGETRIAMEKSYILDILATSGIGDIALGTNGAALTYENVVNLVGALTAANVDPDAIKYLLNTAVETALMRTALTLDSSGEPVGDGKILPSGADRLAGRAFELSNVVPSNLVKGSSGAVCSAAIVGDFSGYTTAQWGGIEFLVDGLTQATTGMNRIHCAVYHDGTCNDAGKFAAAQDVLTA